MPGHAESEAAKHHAALHAAHEHEKWAVDVYNKELAAGNEQKGSKSSYWGVVACFGLDHSLLRWQQQEISHTTV